MPVRGQETTQPLWRKALGGAVISAPSAQAGSVALVNDAGSLLVYGEDGAPLWTYTAPGKLLPFVTRSREGTSYICRVTGILIAINRSGRELWRVDLGAPLIAPPILGWDGRIFALTASRVRCLTETGAALWTTPVAASPSLPLGSDGRGGLFVCAPDNTLTDITAFGVPTAHSLPAPPSAAAPVQTTADDHKLMVCWPGGDAALIDLTAGAGAKTQLHGLGAAVLAAAAAGPGRAAALLAGGRVALVSLDAGGAVLWTGDTHLADQTGQAGGAARPDDGAVIRWDGQGIYVLSRGGATGFSPDGRRLWIIRIQGAASPPSFSDGGVLYSGGADWILYAYRLEERVPALRGLLYGPAPEGAYGLGVPRPALWKDNPWRYDTGDINAAFREIRRALDDGSAGVREIEYASRLMDVASAALGPQEAQHPPVLIDLRVEALRLLALLGSRELVPFLVDVFTRDRDPLARAAAARALGRVGVDPAGLAIRAFTTAVFPQAPERDPVVLAAVAEATGALCRFAGPPLSEAGARVLVALAAPDRPFIVRAQAEKEIETLRPYPR